MTISERLFAVRQIEHDNGDVTWVPADLDTFTNDDQFQVFNTFTGQHEYFDNIVDAKARWDDLKQQIIDTFLVEPPTPSSNNLLTFEA